MKSNAEIWESYKDYYREYPVCGFAADFCRMDFTEEFLNKMAPKVERALADMQALEKGAIANPDENRMVGHYWLRNPSLAPTKEIAADIQETISTIKLFAEKIHSGQIVGGAGPFKNVLLIGIGGSALGPQFIAHALGSPIQDKVRMFFLDNTDPDGMDRVFQTIGNGLGQTLCIVVSKSGGTKETRNGMIEAQFQYQKMGLVFEHHAVAVTMPGSALDNLASNWICRFPMWDWVGGRTSLLSSVGLLPTILQGFDIDGMLDGARTCDSLTRSRNPQENPALMLALSWFLAGNGRGERMLVVLPYKDRLELFSKYLQQLIMESVGKEMDSIGNVVNQGISVFGNKGATDQHSYIQQLRDGLDNFMVVFVEVLKDRIGESVRVEPETTSGDFLHSFLLGTREALYEKGRKSVSLTIDSVSARSIGFLVALFERAVGLYSSLININAYHQPGVQAGKVAADEIIALKRRIVVFLESNRNRSFSVPQIASAIGVQDQSERVFKLCKHLSFNDRILIHSPHNSSGDAILFAGK